MGAEHDIDMACVFGVSGALFSSEGTRLDCPHPQIPETLGNSHSPWAQVVQAVLGVHVDQWDPGSDAERDIIKLLCITDNISLLWQQSELKINK